MWTDYVVPIRRRWPVALIAVILCLFLMGAGVVAVIYGDRIQNLFGHYFELMTGQNMSEGQNALIDHLSQDISQSKTVGETTVTVDPVTVGDDIFYLLLRVEGVELSNRPSYSFDGRTLEVYPDPLERVDGIGSHGIQYQGMDGDGVALLLMDYSYATQEGFELDTTPYRGRSNLLPFCLSSVGCGWLIDAVSGKQPSTLSLLKGLETKVT